MSQYVSRRPPVPDLCPAPALLAIPPLQAQIAHAEHRPVLADAEGEAEPVVVDPNRIVPTNFCASVHSAYLALPTVCVPEDGAKLRGKSNYTIRDKDGRVVQVHLSSKCFFIKKKSGGVVWNKEDGSPNMPWSLGGSVAACWEQLVAKLGGWSV